MSKQDDPEYYPLEEWGLALADDPANVLNLAREMDANGDYRFSKDEVLQAIAETLPHLSLGGEPLAPQVAQQLEAMRAAQPRIAALEEQFRNADSSQRQDIVAQVAREAEPALRLEYGMAAAVETWRYISQGTQTLSVIDSTLSPGQQQELMRYDFTSVESPGAEDLNAYYLAHPPTEKDVPKR